MSSSSAPVALGDGGVAVLGHAHAHHREPLLQRGAAAHDAGDDEAVVGRGDDRPMQR